MSKKNSNYYNTDKFFKSKIFLTIVSFLLGASIMFALIYSVTSTNLFVQKVINENIKTTTLEEVSDLKKAINKVYDSAVYIEVTGNRTSASGSGFIYKIHENKAYILTNYHVIENGSMYKVTLNNGDEVDATLLNGDEYYDIAVLTIPSNNVKQVAVLGNSDNLELGDTVFTVGAPLGKDYMGTITKGIISSKDRMVAVKLSKGNYIMEVIQTDASINEGNSGGPICNIEGEVVGITSSKLIGSGVEGMGFAIPINKVKELINDFESGVKLERPYFGVQLLDLTNTFVLQYYYNIRISSDVEFGAVISIVEEGMPASLAGLKVGDVIIEMDGERVSDTSHFKYILYKHKIGDKILVKYYRENKLQETIVELKESAKSE